MKLISIIVPVYQVEKYVARCIDSILGQTYKNIELILVDDGSTDQGGKICDEYALNDSRIHVIHKANGGLSSARNAALDVTTGEYVTFVDGDDLIHPQMLEKMLLESEQSGADIVSTGLHSFYEESPKIDRINDFRFERLTQRDYIDNLYPQNFGKISVTACGKLYKRELFYSLRYPEGMIYEDLRVYLDLLLNCNMISVVNYNLYYWYHNVDSITRSNYLKHDRFGEFIVRESFIGFFEKRGLHNQSLYATNDYLTFFMRNYFAVMLRYQKKKEEMEPHIDTFKHHMVIIQNNPYVCRMRKICAKLMLVVPCIAYIVAKYTIPDCLIEEMR